MTALKLDGYFEHLVIGSECSRAKPFPDPYIEVRPGPSIVASSGYTTPSLVVYESYDVYVVRFSN